MMNVRRTALAAALIAAIGVPAAFSAGIWPMLPIVGSPSFCGASVGATPAVGTQTGQGAGSTICAQTIPAGPVFLTGSELIPGDTRLAGGASPQTVTIPVGLLNAGAIGGGSWAGPKNLFRNGDISVNPFQFGTSQAANISNTVTTGADGFRFQGGASSAIQWSQQTGAADIVAGQFTASLRFQRASANTDTAQVCQISVLTSGDSVALQGQNFVYSFWAKPGANFSPTNGNIVVSVASSTGSDQSSANFKAASWTAQTNQITAGASSNSSFPVAVATAQATISTLPASTTATWTQYWVSGTFPATSTQVGTSICFTPVGTAGANDFIETANHQLEIVGPGVATPTAFEHHTAQADLSSAQRFAYVISDNVVSTRVLGLCQATAATTADCVLQLPVTMRAVPATTVVTATSFGVTVAAGTAGTCTTLAATATSNTVNQATLTCTTGSTLAAGNAAKFIGANTGAANKVAVSAEL